MGRDDLAWSLAQRLNAISTLAGDEIAEHLVCPDCGGPVSMRVHPTKPVAVAWCPADDSHFWWSGQDVVRKPWMEKYVGADGFVTVQFDDHVAESPSFIDEQGVKRVLWRDVLLALIPGVPWYTWFAPWPVAVLAHLVSLVLSLIAIRRLLPAGAEVVATIACLVISVMAMSGGIMVQQLLTGHWK